MNLARLPQPNELQDEHRPLPEFWGPVQVKDQAGGLLDTAHSSAIPATLDRPSTCPVCTETSIEALGVVYGYPVYRCLKCDVGFIWPQPSNELLQQYYGPTYWSTYMNDTRTLYERKDVCDTIFKRQAQYFDRLLHGRKDARILDVGAGDGTMLRLLKDMGYTQAQGFDLDAENCKRAHDRLGVDVRQVDFLSYQEGGWDAITLWAVIEHLKSPRPFVEHAYKLLKPGGYLVMMTGDNASSCAWVQGCFDMWLYPPEHLFFYGKRSLRQLYQAGGFREISTRVGYQHWFKEYLLTGRRLVDSTQRLFRSRTRPHWRSTASNLLVISGRK